MDARTAFERRARRMAKAGCYRQAWRALLGASMLAPSKEEPLPIHWLHAHFATKKSDQ